MQVMQQRDCVSYQWARVIQRETLPFAEPFALLDERC